jgi:hypothetical protein
MTADLVSGTELRHLFLATIKALVCTDWEKPQSILRLPLSRPIFEIGISPTQKRAVQNVVTPWHGCTSRPTVWKIMHLDPWRRSLCSTRTDENRAFKMGRQSVSHVSWELRKIGRGNWQSGGGGLVLYEIAQSQKVFTISIRLTSATDTTYLKCDLVSGDF